eukprot:152647-Prymnesium_polylepis.1
MSKLWGGRFTGKTDPVMERFNNSLNVDRVMWRADIEGSIAYSSALEAAGVLSAEEGSTIREGLKKVMAEWEAGTFVEKEGDEDIHTANERRLTELVGPVGGKVHTGRSRNDQVVTDLRLHLRGECKRLAEWLRTLILTAAKRAAAEADLLMPGYTHLQSAQPIRWSHWMLAHACTWKRDAERLEQIIERFNEMPLGSGALAGNPFGVDREALATSLGFRCPMANSIDGVTVGWADPAETPWRPQPPATESILPGGRSTGPLHPSAVPHWPRCWPYLVDALCANTKTLAARLALRASISDLAPKPSPLASSQDRDFVVELCFWSSLLMVHLSKFGEDLIIYGSQEFGFVKFACATRGPKGTQALKPNPHANPRCTHPRA